MEIQPQSEMINHTGRIMQRLADIESKEGQEVQATGQNETPADDITDSGDVENFSEGEETQEQILAQAKETLAEAEKEKLQVEKEAKEVEKEKEKVAEKKDKDWWEDEEAVTSDKESKEPIGDNKKVLAELQSQVDEYKALLSDPEFELFVNAKKAGKNLLDLADEIKPVDYSKVSPEDIRKMQLAELGELTQEEIQEELDQFSSLSKVQKLATIKSYRDKLQADQAEKAKRLSSGLAQTAKAQQERSKQIVAEANSELDTILDGMKGKPYFGLVVDDQIAAGIANYIRNDAKSLIIDPTTQKIQVEDMVELALWKNYKKLIVKANVTKAKSQGKTEVLEEYARGSESTKSVRPPVGKTNEESVEEARAIFKRMNPTRTVQAKP